MDVYKIEDLVDSGNYEQAVKEADKAIGRGETAALAFLSRGRAYLQLGKCRQAMVDFNKAIWLGMEEPMLYDERGHAHLELGDYGHAKEDFDAAIRLGLQEARFWRGESGEQYLYETRDPLRYSLAQVYYHRGAVQIELEDYERALSDLTEAVTLAPHEADWYDTRALVYSKLSRPDEGQQDLDKADELRKGSST